MRPDQLARGIWIKTHMAGVLAARQRSLGNNEAARDRISLKISKLRQQIGRMERKLDALAVTDE